MIFFCFNFGKGVTKIRSLTTFPVPSNFYFYSIVKLLPSSYCHKNIILGAHLEHIGGYFTISQTKPISGMFFGYSVSQRVLSV